MICSHNYLNIRNYLNSNKNINNRVSIEFKINYLKETITVNHKNNNSAYIFVNNTNVILLHN